MKLFSPLAFFFILFITPSTALSSDLFTLLKTQSCVKCDLSFSDLNYAEFKNGDLSESNLSYLNASRSTFFNYSFRSAKLSHANFRHARLISSDFTGVIFDDVIFEETIVTGSTFDYDNVPPHVVINSVDFPLHNLSNTRIQDLFSTTSPETHPDFYLSLLDHLKDIYPDDPSISLLKAQFFYKHQLNYTSSASSLEDAALQLKSMGQVENAAKVSKLSNLIRLQSESNSNFEMPNTRGNGLGIAGINSISEFFSDILPALTSLGGSLFR